MLSGWLSSRVGFFEGSFLFMTRCLLICKNVVCTCAVLLQFMASVRAMFCNVFTCTLCKPLFLPPQQYPNPCGAELIMLPRNAEVQLRVPCLSIGLRLSCLMQNRYAANRH